MSVKKGSLVGCQYAQIWLAGSNGYAYGTAGDGMAQGATSHAHLLAYPVSAQVPNPARVVTNLQGGNRWLGQVQWGIGEVGNFPLVLENIDADAFALLTASAVDATTNTRWRQFTDNKNNPTLPQVGLMLSTLFQSREAGSDGANYWINYIIPRCQIDVNFPQMGYQAEGQVNCNVAPTMSELRPDGTALTALSAKNNRLIMYAIVTPKPLGLTTFIADATLTTFTLGYKPTSNIVTLNAAAVQLAINGTLTAASSVNTSTGAVTLAAAGTAGHPHIAMYETDFELAA